MTANSEKIAVEEVKCKALADNAQKDLEEALPALEEAMKVAGPGGRRRQEARGTAPPAGPLRHFSLARKLLLTLWAGVPTEPCLKIRVQGVCFHF